MTQYVGDALLAHANAGCYRCSRGDSLVDFDAQIVGEGALVLCRGCIAEGAEAAGLLSNTAAVSELQAELERQRLRADNASARETRFLAALDAGLAEAAIPHEVHVPDDLCASLTKAGNPCKGTPIKDGHCFAHAPVTA